MVVAPENRQNRRHETKALLRAHLSAAARYGHATRNCPVCHRLQRLALEEPPEAFEPAPLDPDSPITGPTTSPRATLPGVLELPQPLAAVSPLDGTVPASPDGTRRTSTQGGTTVHHDAERRHAPQ